MASEITINGNKLAPIREIVAEVSYSRDYVTRLAREGKIVASLIGRQWFVDLESLRAYAQRAELEAHERKLQLSEERKKEQLFHTARQHKETARMQKQSSFHSTAAVMASLVLVSGLLAGAAGYAVFGVYTPVASLSPANVLQNTHAPAAATTASVDSLAPEETAAGTAPQFSRKEVRPLESAQNGILIIPADSEFDTTAVFSDEVYVRTATSGQQSAVLVDENGSERTIPFVVVPVKTSQN